MKIKFIEPISCGWNRMTNALFKPFDLGKWFIIGFTTFLADLTDWHGGSGGGGGKGKGRADLDDLVEFPHNAWNWLMDHPGWFTLIIAGIIFLIGVIILLTWLSSRGKFMFLDNAVHNRAMVTQPWREYKRHGNSLFIWRFFFGLLCLTLFILIMIQVFYLIIDINESGFMSQLLPVIGYAIIIFAVMLITGYISLFLTDFVVPIMYINNISAIKAWQRFLSLFSKYWLYFTMYGLLVFILYFFGIMLIIMAGFLTCCLGFILLIIPFINSVITLPFSYFFRSFSLEFLEQFGPEFKVFPETGAE